MTRRFTLQAATELAAQSRSAAPARTTSRPFAGASDRLRRRARQRFDRHWASHGLSCGVEGGRIVGDAEPLITSPAPAAIHCDARGGIAQLASTAPSTICGARAGTFGSRCSRRTEATLPANSAITRAPRGCRSGRLRRDERASADDCRRARKPCLLHQSARFRRAGRRRAAAADRSGVQRDRLCPA